MWPIHESRPFFVDVAREETDQALEAVRLERLIVVQSRRNEMRAFYDRGRSSFHRTLMKNQDPLLLALSP